MFKRLIIVISLLFPLYTFAQTGITGGVFDQENKSFPLQKVLVRNLNNQKVVITGAAGQFTIQASKGDLLEFSLPGYHTDTLYLTSLVSKTIYLPSQSNALKEVKIQSTKVSSDLRLKDPNARGFSRVSGIQPKGNIGRAGGLGISIDGNRAKKEKAKVEALELKSAYETEINQYFNEEHVGNLIKLKGQELKDFINFYRPTVERVKSDDPFNYDFYIAQAYQSWLKLPPDQRKLPPMQKLEKK